MIMGPPTTPLYNFLAAMHKGLVRSASDTLCQKHGA